MLSRSGPSLVRLIKTITSTTSSSIHCAEQIQALVSKTGHASNEYVRSALITLYATLECIMIARRLLDDVSLPGLFSWTSMVRAYSTSNRPKEALQLFCEMRRVCLTPDLVALTIAMSACRLLEDPASVKMIHGFIIKSGIEIDEFAITEMIKHYGDRGELELARRLFDEMPDRTLVAWNALIYQYAKNELLETAHQLFDEMPRRDVISWNTMISAFLHAGLYREGLALFHNMESSVVKPNKLTMSIVLSACAALGALETALWIHAYVQRNAMNLDGSLDYCFIDMYAKCGSIEKAVQVFDKVPTRRDLYSWTSIICAFAMHGQAEQAICFFSRMQDAGVRPDSVTLVGVLSACAHAGLVNHGCQYFQSMEVLYGISPKIEHYGCMVDLLGRSGRLREAYNLVMEMSMNPNAAVWRTLLSACKVHNDVELGEIAAVKLIELDPFDPWARVMLSNTHANANDWCGVMRLRKEMKGAGARRTPGCSSIEVNGVVHEFLPGVVYTHNMEKFKLC